MKPLSVAPREELAAIRGVLFDLDDTVLTRGRLTESAYSALCRLAESGILITAVTGRPAGWGEILVRQWPLAGAVTENGAIWVVRDGDRVGVVDRSSENERRSRRIRLAQLIEKVREVVPEARLTDDLAMRRSDVTWDIGEQMRLPDERIALIVREIEAVGAQKSQSSVHLHATFESDDKATGTLAYLEATFKVGRATALESYAFIGDSGNDAPCFATFQTTVGVANIRKHIGHLHVLPRYVTESEMGAGFVEFATALVRSRD